MQRAVASKAARSPGVVRRAGKSFNCPRVLKKCFDAYILPNVKYCASLWMSSAGSHLGLLDRVIRSAERWYESELCCLGNRRNDSAFCLFYKIHHIEDHPLHEYLHHCLADALCELALMIPRCRTDQFSRLFLPVAVRLWKLLPLDFFSGGALSTFRSAI